MPLKSCVSKWLGLTDYLFTLLTVNILYYDLITCAIKINIVTSDSWPQILHVNAVQVDSRSKVSGTLYLKTQVAVEFFRCVFFFFDFLGIVDSIH